MRQQLLDRDVAIREVVKTRQLSDTAFDRRYPSLFYQFQDSDRDWLAGQNAPG